MADLPHDLRSALDTALASVPAAQLTSTFQRLSARYRDEHAATTPIMASQADVITYSAYRMPATYAAVRSALEQAALQLPSFEPGKHFDIGGGTGSAVWAATDVWPSLSSVTVLEQVPEAIALGKKLMAGAESPAVRRTSWTTARLDASTFEQADLVTVSYVLSELSESQQRDLVAQLSAQQGLVALIEPGTPGGYERIVAARDQLLAAGHSVIAPCPHDLACPIPRGRDWCHFTSRVNRSAVHRRTKGAELGFEDEKFSYVVTSPTLRAHAANRVLRHPQQRKGLVSLRLCARDGELRDELVSKRQGPLYKTARNTEYGDPWPS
ncbi:small ribosomal subunit Rsm22 family protein [Kribbella sp. NPDC051770]|uniref:small ribosomal subunit Rsm22 family protein n=1 Tax=Kribbella sp. NPDC051770 TaxID=3155413 RepID=UPI00343E186B